MMGRATLEWEVFKHLSEPSLSEALTVMELQERTGLTKNQVRGALHRLSLKGVERGDYGVGLWERRNPGGAP